MAAENNIDQIKTAVILGAGNVAWHLSHGLSKRGIKIRQIYSRNTASSHSLSNSPDTQFISLPEEIDRSSDLFVLAVSDDAIENVAASIGFLRTGILVHTSGTVPMEVLSAYSADYGVVYPVQTFTKGRSIDFKNVPFLLEGSDDRVYQKLQSLTANLSDHIYPMNSGDRLIMHCAAVISSNFANYLMLLSEDLVKEYGLTFDLLKSLMIETISKAFETGPVKSQTGPARRGNKKVIDAHLKLLESRPEIKKIYEMLSQGIMNRVWNDPGK